jgi:hypothetical protein
MLLDLRNRHIKTPRFSLETGSLKVSLVLIYNPLDPGLHPIRLALLLLKPSSCFKIMSSFISNTWCIIVYVI